MCDAEVGAAHVEFVSRKVGIPIWSQTVRKGICVRLYYGSLHLVRLEKSRALSRGQYGLRLGLGISAMSEGWLLIAATGFIWLRNGSGAFGMALLAWLMVTGFLFGALALGNKLLNGTRK